MQCSMNTVGPYGPSGGERVKLLWHLRMDGLKRSVNALWTDSILCAYTSKRIGVDETSCEC